MTLPPLYVLRHGETEWNKAGRLQGALNSPLTKTGESQAAAQGALLAGLDLCAFDIRVSPQGRAIQTAAIALASRVTHLQTDMRLRELEMGQWSGLRRDQMTDPVLCPVGDCTPDGYLAPYDRAPGGEGFAALRDRCAAFLADLDRPTLCVTHGVTSRMLRVLALGQPPATLGDLPGGQGVVHVVKEGEHATLR